MTNIFDVGWVVACFPGGVACRRNSGYLQKPLRVYTLREGLHLRRVTQQPQPIALGGGTTPNLRNLNTSKTFVSQPGTDIVVFQSNEFVQEGQGSILYLLSSLSSEF
ncbi:MAG: hypothetical protein QNJ47_12310 [Nostocaceae cyanobacterium]|nr:hypothetical protein [Nostocaceae cyanobacterium]